jgi:hypothetical protein
MTQSYLLRNDVGYPAQSDPRGIYAIKVFENLDLILLQDEVNLYLLELPAKTKRWAPHVVSIQYSNYNSTGPIALFHVCVVGLYASGTIVAPPN